MAALAAAVLVRGAGDVIDNSGSALSWFSPIAWAQQMRPFVALRWWPLGLLAVLAVALAAATLALESRRQYDDGVLASSGERSKARPVGGVFGLQLGHPSRPDPGLGNRTADRRGGVRVDVEVTAGRRQR